MHLSEIGIRPDSPNDRQAIKGLLIAAFEKSAEPQRGDEIRSPELTEMSLVTKIDGRIVGRPEQKPFKSVEHV